MSDAVTDTAGNKLPKSSWAFVTSGEGPDNDTTKPSVTSRSPGAGATGVVTGANVLIGFSEPVARRAAARRSTCRRCDGSGCRPRSTATPPRNTVIVNPTDPLAAGTAYDVVLAAAVTDLAGDR